MSKYTKAAEQYFEKQDQSFPMTYEKLNTEVTVILGAYCAIEIFLGLLLGWLSHLIVFEWFSANKYLTITNDQFILILLLYFALGFVIGIFSIYKKKLPSLLEKEEALFFTGRVFQFADIFSRGLFILTFCSNFFGV